MTVCQVTSDQASALISHTEQHLGAHHSPDLFHVQQDTVESHQPGPGRSDPAVLMKPPPPPRSKPSSGSKNWRLASSNVRRRPACRRTRNSGRDQAQAAEAEARQRLTACQQRQQQATEARQAISHDYHPIDLETGQSVDAGQSRPAV